MSRAITLFNTSAIGSTSTITSATYSLWNLTKRDELTPAGAMSVVTTNPASNTTLAASDYSQTGDILQAPIITLANITTNAYNDFALNSTGLSNISKTGVTKFGMRLDADRTNTEPTYCNCNSDASFSSADTAGTTQDPKLVVEHSAAVTVTGELYSTSFFNDANLRAYYRLEDVNDATANNYNLTNTGSVSFNAGKFNNGADYGTGNTGGKYLSIDSQLGMPSRSSDRTYSFWYKAKAMEDGGEWLLFTHGYSASKSEIDIHYYRIGSTYTLSWEDSNTGASSGGGGFYITKQLIADTWYHFAWVRASGVLYGYLDGVLQGQVAITDTTGASTTNDKFVIGQLARTGYDRNIDGIVDDFAVFNRALTAQEISNIYNGVTIPTPTATAIATPTPTVTPTPTTYTYVIQPGSEGKDTFYGTVYATNGNPDAELLYIGGWADWYYDLFEFDLTGAPSASDTVSATLYLYGSAPNDPVFQLNRITQSWTESGVTRANNPASIFYKNFGSFAVGSSRTWNSVDITDLYKGWKNGTYSNYGIKLVPTNNNHSNGEVYSSDNIDVTYRPKLVIVHNSTPTPTPTDTPTPTPVAGELYSTSLFNDANLKAYYRLENLSDSTANGYNLTNNNSVAFNAAKFNNGADLGTTNTNKYLSTTSLLGIPTVSASRTYSFWYKSPAMSGGDAYHLIFGHGYSVNRNEYVAQVHWNGSTLYYIGSYSHSGGNGAYNSTPVAITAQTWYHFALVRDGSTMLSYINGVLRESSSSFNDNTGYTALPDGFNLGMVTHTSADWGVGLIDDFAVFDRALTAQEISNIYNGVTPTPTPTPTATLTPIPTPTPMGSGQVAYYPFNGNANDESGNGNNGTVYGATLTADKTGNMNSAYSFNGNNYIDIGNNVTAGSQFSEAVWIYPTSSDGNFHGFLGYGVGDPQRPPSLWVYQNTKIHGGFGDGTNWNAFVTGSIITQNAWNHVVATFDGTDYKVYINGALQYSNGSFAGRIPYSTPIKTIGKVDNFFVGAIDEVRIYNRAISASEILELYVGTPTNTAPVANAGTDQSASVGSIVTLDGSGSSDSDGNTLTYSWTFTSKPTGSNATLTNPTSVNPTFTADVEGTYIVSLIVNDGALDSAPDTVTVNAQPVGTNVAPIANAGHDQSAYVGNTVTLDGSGSSDADGNLLTYTWAFTSKPTDSTATLSDAAAVNPTFTVDKAGTYVVSLVVNDGTVNSTADTVTISTLNSAPVANAGQDQSVYVGNTVILDGSGSSDMDGNILTYTWAFTSKPIGSTATLANPTSVNPTFTVDKAGIYVVSLIVNDGTVNSAADTVTISTQNSAPVANAGADQFVYVGDVVTLNGGSSYDIDGDLITYRWTLVSRPIRSTTTLNDSASVNPLFTVDAAGSYRVRLIVNDGMVDSIADTVTISTRNLPPVANAGTDRSVNVGNTVTLDGSGSTDPDGDLITHSWSFSLKPSGSTATLSDAAAVNPTFTIDKAGTYVVSLMVNDGTVDSNQPDTATISTLNSAPVANAGTDQSGYVNDTVTLDGSNSSDVDGNLLTYKWAFTTKPQDSNASLSDQAAVNPTFTIDKAGTYVVSLIVNDGTVDGNQPDTATISTLNSAPVASAGTDQSVYVTETVTLNGAGSTDVDGDLLTYTWAFTSKPTVSAATLSDVKAVSPTFTIDKAGTYAVSLIVNDGTVDSNQPDTVTISTLNSAPVASAGTDQAVYVNGFVTLDGSYSSDIDGDALSYVWAFTAKPSGSNATLGNPTTPSPTFTVDVSGIYVVSLIVNDGAVDSQPDTVTISTLNSAPIAYVVANQSVYINDLVTLNGGSSWDPDGDTLTYNWAFTAKPAGSNAALSDQTSVNPTFTVDRTGTYIVSLIVNDGKVDSVPVTVSISTLNSQPIADAGLDQSVYVGSRVTLDGNGSSDPDGDLLTYNWAFTSKPSGSNAALVNSTIVNTTFNVDVAGNYVVSLVVNDGKVDSVPDKMTISAVTIATAAIGKTQNAIDALNGLSESVFNNPKNKKALTNKLNSVIEKLEKGEYEDAMKKLDSDILKKMDGCALAGAPDKNDWIRDCNAQAVVYPLIVDIINLLKQVDDDDKHDH